MHQYVKVIRATIDITIRHLHQGGAVVAAMYGSWI